MSVINYVYILECSDNTLYTGWTTDLKKRISAHNSGKGAKYTKSRLPVKLVYFESFSVEDFKKIPTDFGCTDPAVRCKKAATAREYAIKKLSKKEKLKLMSGFKLPEDFR